MNRNNTERESVLEGPLVPTFSFNDLSSKKLDLDGTEAKPPVEAVQQFVGSQRSFIERISITLEGAFPNLDPLLAFSLGGSKFSRSVLRRIKRSNDVR